MFNPLSTLVPGVPIKDAGIPGLSYPIANFHFAVLFHLFPPVPNDVSFQEVSGLSVNVEAEDYNEGGENRFVHKLPSRTSYNSLQLKRGIFIGSPLIWWVRKAVEQFVFKPVDVNIALLNDMHIPIAAWHVVNAYPQSWTTEGFNAQGNEVAVETLELHYDYFKTLRI